MRRFVICVAAILSTFALTCSAASQGSPTRSDSSDWWSLIRREEFPSSEHITPEDRQPAETNFQIAGITLGSPFDFSDIRSKYGEGAEVTRGDAASFRDQMCYVSPSGDVHLIFEFGEVESVLYLLQGGKSWNGDELCARSNAVSINSSTASGLRLGIAPEQLRSILGNPVMATTEKLIYCFGYRIKTSPEALAKSRKNYPEMSDAEFAKNFEYADGYVYIEARFSAGKLNLLAISKSETY